MTLSFEDHQVSVVYGATIKAAIQNKIESEITKDVLFIDIIQKTINVDFNDGGIIGVFFRRDTSLPHTSTCQITNYRDNQTKMTFSAYEGTNLIIVIRISSAQLK